MLHRPHRRPRRRPLRGTALLATGVLVASPLLASCGFNYQTDQVNTISAGVNDREGDIDVLGAVVIAGEPDVGLFVATLANNSLDQADVLQGLQESEDLGPLEPATEASGVEIPAAGRANLFESGGIAVKGLFGAGDFVDVTLSFENGQVSRLTVPVVTPCHQFSPESFPNLELPEAPATEGETTVETEETEEAESESEGLPGPYSCEAAEPVEHGEPAEEPAE